MWKGGVNRGIADILKIMRTIKAKIPYQSIVNFLIIFLLLFLDTFRRNEYNYRRLKLTTFNRRRDSVHRIESHQMISNRQIKLLSFLARSCFFHDQT